MEEKPQSKIKEALKNKLEKKFNTNLSKDNKVNQSFNKRNKIRVDSLGKRTQNRGN